MKKLLLALLLFCSPAFGANQQSFGDSTTHCTVGPSSLANCYVQLLANATGRTLINNGVNGTLAGDMAVTVENTTFAPTDLVTFLIGVNDSQRYWSTYQQTLYQRILMGAALKVVAPNRLYPADAAGNFNAAMTRTGTWYARQPDVRIMWPSKGVLSNVSGSTISGTVTGSTIYIGTTMQDYQGGGLAGTVEVRIDGSLVGTVSSDGLGICTAQRCDPPGVFRFPGLANTSHTVLLTLTSGFFYFEYMLGNGGQPTPIPLYIGTPTRTYQPADVNGPPAAIALGQKVTDIATQLTADGFPVTAVAIYPLITSAYVVADQIHINDAGNVLMANAFLAAQGPPPPPPPPPTYVPAFICWNGTNYFGATDSACTQHILQLQ